MSCKSGTSISRSLKDDEVLVRVHAAAVNIGDWHLLRGVPYVMRAVSGLRKPRREVPGLDIAGRGRGGREERHAVSAGR